MSRSVDHLGRASLIGLLILCMMWRPSLARAQACCGASNTTDFGVAAPHARATVAAALGYRQGLGSFDAQGVFARDARLVDRDAVLRVGAGVRLWYRPLQIHGSFPVRIQHRQVGDVSATATGIGDASAALRWIAVQPTASDLALDDPSTFVPLLALFAGAKAPTGNSPSPNRNPSHADVFGNGVWELMFGGKLTKSLSTQHQAAVRAQYDVRFRTRRPRARSGDVVTFKPGNQLSLRVEWLYTRSIFWSGGAFAAVRMTSPAAQDGSELSGSKERLFNLGGQVTYAFAYPKWDITAVVSSDAFWDRGGVNVPFASAGATLVLRRIFLGGRSDHGPHEGHEAHHHGAAHHHP